MASGDPVVTVLAISPPGSSQAIIDYRVGSSTPTEQIEVRDFDDSTIQYMDLLCVLNGYDGGGLTFTLPWSATTATSGVTRWGIGIRRMQDDAEDIDTSHSYIYNDVDDTAASASGEISYPTIAFTDGADMDSWADGELAVVRIRRNATHGNDTMSGDAELWGLMGKET